MAARVCRVEYDGVGLVVQGSLVGLFDVLHDARRHGQETASVWTPAGDRVELDASLPWSIKAVRGVARD